VIFKKSKNLELQMDAFLDKISESGIVFRRGVKNYMRKDAVDFDTHLQQIITLEHEADELRKSIETQLYTQTLVPESRGDILALMETSDDVIDRATDTLSEMSIENPMIPEAFRDGFIELARSVVRAMEEMVKALRAFMRDPINVRNYLHKVYYWEKESDRLAGELKRAIFADDTLTLSQKIHLRYFALHVDTIADRAEDVADRLAIYTIKRSI
jgi:predicted phosphate transport protein (TIGR00153 family)